MSRRRFKPLAALRQCDVCGFRPATERHFVTVPIPEAFTRICVEDIVAIKKEIRRRVKEIVAEVFAEAKARQLKELLKER